jgi:tetratricopeptide (TPR) repeat protein
VATGWFWYLGTLVPVIGLIQIGEQARADRYMYIPMTGLLIVVAWGAMDILKRWPRAALILGAAACASAAVVTSVQAQYWRNTPVLFQHALDATGENYLAHDHLGNYFLHLPGQLAQSISHFKEAVRIHPVLWEAHSNLGLALLQTPGGLPEAMSHLETAIRLNPNYLDAHNNLASAFMQIPGRLPEAISQYEISQRIAPNSAEVQYNLGVALSLGPSRLAEAADHFEAAIRLSPDADTHTKLAQVLLRIPGRGPEALNHLQMALRIDPGYEPARQLLGRLRAAPAGLPGH